MVKWLTGMIGWLFGLVKWKIYYTNAVIVVYFEYEKQRHQASGSEIDERAMEESFSLHHGQWDKLSSVDN